MKQMRSRFRMITLLLVCAFLLTLSLCAGNALRSAGITLSSFSPSDLIDEIIPVNPSVSPDAFPEADSSPAPSEAIQQETPFPDSDISPNPEYNIFGL